MKFRTTCSPFEGVHPQATDLSRDLGLALARLAVAYAKNEQPDHALDVARHAFQIFSETQSARTRAELKELSDIIAVGEGREDVQALLRTYGLLAWPT
ncbi:hypothetical protein [Actinosynnema sp. NPDC023587]|uniref:hypothetical protein n=1 Tax=Actinosynnema sp. NPDC023587 TaxID=3154695 RepID=UPI0034028338